MRLKFKTEEDGPVFLEYRQPFDGTPVAIVVPAIRLANGFRLSKKAIELAKSKTVVNNFRRLTLAERVQDSPDWEVRSVEYAESGLVKVGSWNRARAGLECWDGIDLTRRWVYSHDQESDAEDAESWAVREGVSQELVSVALWLCSDGERPSQTRQEAARLVVEADSWIKVEERSQAILFLADRIAARWPKLFESVSGSTDWPGAPEVLRSIVVEELRRLGSPDAEKATADKAIRMWLKIDERSELVILPWALHALALLWWESEERERFQRGLDAPSVPNHTAEKLLEVWSRGSRVEVIDGFAVVSGGSKTLGKASPKDAPANAPAVDGRLLLNAVQRFGSVNGGRVIQHVVTETFNQHFRGVADNDIQLVYDGGIREFAEAAGCGKLDQDRDDVSKILTAAHATQIEWWGGWSSILRVDLLKPIVKRPGRPVYRLVIKPGFPIQPGYIYEFGDSRPEREHRFKIPVTPYPELSGHCGLKFPELLCWLHFCKLTIERRREVQKRGGVTLDSDTVGRMMRDVGPWGERAPGPSFVLANFERYCREGADTPATLEKVDTTKDGPVYMFANNNTYGRFRRMVFDAAGAGERRKRREVAKAKARRKHS